MQSPFPRRIPNPFYRKPCASSQWFRRHPSPGSPVDEILFHERRQEPALRFQSHSGGQHQCRRGYRHLQPPRQDRQSDLQLSRWTRALPGPPKFHAGIQVDFKVSSLDIITDKNPSFIHRGFRRFGLPDFWTQVIPTDNQVFAGKSNLSTISPRYRTNSCGLIPI